jgi:hypothetical protein
VNCSPNDTASYPRRPAPSATPLWEYQVSSQVFKSFYCHVCYHDVISKIKWYTTFVPFICCSASLHHIIWVGWDFFLLSSWSFPSSKPYFGLPVCFRSYWTASFVSLLSVLLRLVKHKTTLFNFFFFLPYYLILLNLKHRLSLRSKLILKKLLVPQLTKKFPAFYMFTRVRPLSLSLAR